MEIKKNAAGQLPSITQLANKFVFELETTKQQRESKLREEKYLRAIESMMKEILPKIRQAQTIDEIQYVFDSALAEIMKNTAEQAPPIAQLANEFFFELETAKQQREAEFLEEKENLRAIES